MIEPLQIPIDDGQDFESRLNMILSEAVNTLGGKAGIIALWDKKKRRFVEGAVYGLDSRSIDKLRPLLKDTMRDLVSSERSFDQLSRLAHRFQVPATTTEHLQDTVIALPLEIDGAMNGLIFIFRSYSEKPFSFTDQNVLSAFADQVAVTMQNAHLLSRLAGERYALESILENSADGILTISPEKTILSFNSSMERITGWNREEVIGRRCSEVLKLKNNRGSAICHTYCPIAKGIEGFINFEGILTTKDDQEVDVSMNYSVACLPDGESLPTVVNVHDISRRHQIEDLRSSILASVTHELQTPISIIKAYAGTLARDDVKWSEQTLRNKLKAIEEESDNLSKMVSKLLHTTRLECGDYTLDIMPLDLPKQVKNIVNKLSVLTEIHRIYIDFPPEFPDVQADPKKIEEILINLIENAIKYSPHGGKIVIKGKAEGDKVIISVADEGIGIPLRDQEQVFDRFFRVTGTSDKMIRGTGLGLYICKTLIEAHGGQIWLDSKLGKGSRVTFSLPIDNSTDINMMGD